MNDCEVDPEVVKKRVASICVGYTSCELSANDANFGSSPSEPFLCPGWLPACTDDAEAEADAATAARFEKENRGVGHASPRLDKRFFPPFPEVFF